MIYKKKKKCNKRLNIMRIKLKYLQENLTILREYICNIWKFGRDQKKKSITIKRCKNVEKNITMLRGKTKCLEKIKQFKKNESQCFSR